MKRARHFLPNRQRGASAVELARKQTRAAGQAEL